MVNYLYLEYRSTHFKLYEDTDNVAKLSDEMKGNTAITVKEKAAPPGPHGKEALYNCLQ